MKETKEHYFISRTGSLFVANKQGFRWYLLAKPPSKWSTVSMLPVVAASTFGELRNYIKNELGFIPLR